MISVIIPAHNEATTLPHCLRALGAAQIPACGVEVVIVPNGCSDDTAEVARRAAEVLPFPVQIIPRDTGGKPQALNAGDRAAQGDIRLYLDADVQIAPDLLVQIADVLDTEGAAYSSGTLVIPNSPSRITRAFARFYRTVPFIRDGVPGCGLFAVNAAGRARWGDFPQIIADDTFVRLHFTPAERHKIAATYRWPLVDGFRNLLTVRRRQDAGVREIEALYPNLLANDDKLPYGRAALVRTVLRMPLSFAVYASVRLLGRLNRSEQTWSRGR